jgi:Sec7-like guanine-nucleotide exchange factor
VTGEFLGGDKEFNLNALREYANMMDFSQLPLDAALRLFLSGFQLPGEAQKVDRMMERFSVRYCTQNPDIYADADTAYVLAFSIIMLNTDLHNPQVVPEDKMTLDDFVKNCRGVDSALSMEFLSGVFNRILHNPISLRELDRERERALAKKANGVATVYRVLGMNNPRELQRKAQSFLRERDDMVRSAKRRRENARAAAAKASGGDGDAAAPPAPKPLATHSETSAREHVPPMFEVTWQVRRFLLFASVFLILISCLLSLFAPFFLRV